MAGKQLSVLVIEDNPGDFSLVEEFLLDQIEAPKIVHAINYKEAKTRLSESGEIFDVILLDLSLPDKTGVELIKSIVNKSNNTPVIVLTGYADFTFGVKSISQGISDYVLKDELTPLFLHKTIIYSLERRKILSALEESEKRVRSFAKQLSEVVEEERARIAREIHDELGQQLSGLKMSLSVLKNGGRPPEDIGAVIDTIAGDVNHSIQTLRQISNELRPVLLDKLGLFAAIDWLVIEFRKKTGIESSLKVTIDQPAINKDIEINIFRICQEALTNIIKHAAATRVTITIGLEGGDLNIKIVDNGIGIDADNLGDPLSSGLLNMRERAKLIGARINFTNPTNKGTIIEFILSENGKKNINS